MWLRDKLKVAYRKLDSAFAANVGFHFSESSWRHVVGYLHRPRDPASLAVTRLLFGLAMLLDVPDERGGATLERRWGDPRACRFPLLPFVRAAPLPYMALVYTIMWFGAMGVALGYKFRVSALMFAASYWYILLIEKSFWNNHSYLFGLVALLLLTTQAHHYLSLDAFLDQKIHDQPVPQWNYTVLKYQFFLLYFLAGVKKGSREWLSGYAMTNLSDHWVFDPFKLFLTTAQTDFLVVHWFAFLFDLTVAFWMCWSRTRTVAMLFCAAFHFMNSRLFRIGMFPWVCLATMPLFYSEDWPKKVLAKMSAPFQSFSINRRKVQTKKDDKKIIEENKYHNCVGNDAFDIGVIDDKVLQDNESLEPSTLRPNSKGNNDVGVHGPQITKHSCKRQLVTCLVIIYMMLQAFLPFSHFITKGYNNWANGLYGYSWDMMVNSWENTVIVVKVVDNENQRAYYLEPGIWTPNDRWSRHGDMLYQYAQCIKRNILNEIDDRNKCSEDSCPGNALDEWSKGIKKGATISKNISVYIDVWCSLNGRFQQRMFDPSLDLLRAEWSPFRRVAWLMPLLEERTHWRKMLAAIRDEVHSRGNSTDVMFVADFPGHHLENFIAPELKDVVLTVLDGQLVYEPPLMQTTSKRLIEDQSVLLDVGESVPIYSGHLHRVHARGDSPSCYMYTFTNSTSHQGQVEVDVSKKLPIGEELLSRVNNMLTFFKLVGTNLMYFIF